MTHTTITEASAFSTQEFRRALGTFATGLAIITTTDSQGKPVGLTANSFNSVSLSPPLVLWSLAKTASSMKAFMQSTHYAIHILTSEQKHLAERFASKELDRFEQTLVAQNAHGIPILTDALAVFECINRSQHEEGDHVIFVGEVKNCQYNEGRQPLVYHGGRYFTHLSSSHN
jgi:flavin reductase (DIM6/NTAB) family NADH-FMN oxidoreductase RutF